MINLQPVEATNLNEAVYQALRERILSQDFAPGQRLDLPQVETALQVSRTPLKNALTRLEAEGLVDVRPRRGTFVAPISAERIDEGFRIRSAFELYVALCVFKYLTLADFQFFDALRQRMNALVQQAGDHWRDVVIDYLDLDQQLHERFIERGGTPRMLSLFHQMNAHIQIRRIVPYYTRADFEASHFEHGQVFDAIDSRSPERLYAVLLNHLEASRLRALKRLEAITPDKEA